VIKLKKGNRPTILEEHGAAWTAEYVAWVSLPSPRPAVRRRWAHPQIKSALLEETHRKCAYCESHVTHVYPGDAEHMVPKSRVPDLVLEWKNLTFSCAECNRRKRDYYDPAAPLIHPYEDDPECHVRFYGPQAVAAPGSAKGFRTIHKLELDRPQLFDRRRDVIVRLTELLTLWERETDGLAKELRRRAIMDLTQAHSEYAATVRWFLRATPEWAGEDDTAVPSETQIA